MADSSFGDFVVSELIAGNIVNEELVAGDLLVGERIGEIVVCKFIVGKLSFLVIQLLVHSLVNSSCVNTFSVSSFFVRELVVSGLSEPVGWPGYFGRVSFVAVDTSDSFVRVTAMIKQSVFPAAVCSFKPVRLSGKLAGKFTIPLKFMRLSKP